ncbi:hypothetical protein [Sinomicrobium weinanense]|uniref:Uncharacterized protein n=1 Tax=Sinomicrobium weinanense TaxID=2842200 RepID=A0A926JNU9_9FLAO|nr:hypothetical protein [Sinomicrobium weinanense]MBC9794583.1 hypothetical protein [Sinomicrobium weinanense]MBU3124068.1 hypothetical protein [Sinomicrobium weinanense]
MKKKLESELVSIAHDILKLKGTEDVAALQIRAQKVYEKLTVLKFVEEHLGEVQPSGGKSEALMKFEQLAGAVMEENTGVPESNPHSEDIIIPGIDTIKDMVAEMPERETLEDILADIMPDPVFEKRQAEDIAPVMEKTEVKKKSLNDRLKDGIIIGLNDKLAFIKHLFNDSTEDYNRVISQINTIGSEEEARSFIQHMIKPDYNNWEGKEKYEERFMMILEQKFA